MTHSPGPLYHCKCGNDADQWLVIEEKTGRTIGLSYHGEANARLFAASPDLLIALKEIKRCDDNHDDDVHGIDWRAAMERVGAVIATAEGVPPVLCPYHEESLGWDECSEGWDQRCEVERAKAEGGTS